MTLLTRIEEANNGSTELLVQFIVCGTVVGHVLPETARILLDTSDVFVKRTAALHLRPDLDRSDLTEERTEAVGEVMSKLRAEGLITGWRDELLAITPRFSSPPLFLLERAAIPLLGARAYGVHVNGFRRDGDNVRMWLGRRSADKSTFPGKLDQMVAGGQPAGLSVFENLKKECAEEAGLSPEMCARARPVGTIQYCMRTAHGIRPDTLFVYDLELPADVVPENADGEVERFELKTLSEVDSILRTSQAFKTNCSLVVIDFLVRHGYLSPDEPDYESIVTALHRRAL